MFRLNLKRIGFHDPWTRSHRFARLKGYFPSSDEIGDSCRNQKERYSGQDSSKPREDIAKGWKGIDDRVFLIHDPWDEDWTNNLTYKGSDSDQSEGDRNIKGHDLAVFETQSLHCANLHPLFEDDLGGGR